MARPNRIKLERDQAIYHVMTRTVAGTYFFEDPEIKEWIYKNILRLASVYFVELHAIAVLSNHYHIVLSVRKGHFSGGEIKNRFLRYNHALRYPHVWSESRLDHWHKKLTDLSEFMKDLNQSTAAYINKCQENTGHVWGGRFKSVLMEDGPGLLACMAYVELNCVRAGLSSKPTDYRWCSAGRFKQGGFKEAGVVVPKMAAFARFHEKARSKAFGLFVDQLASKEAGEEASFAGGLEEMANWVEKLDLEDLVKMVFHRTRWVTYSFVLGSKIFCSRIAERFHLRNNRNDDFVRISNGLFNSHQRPGYCLK